ncbi:hypothetical protein LTR15_012491 [Elasticomyces elasticus]|nr:hypothetical protein LTR15_012491 [Elasticomyces elasticus]
MGKLLDLGAVSSQYPGPPLPTEDNIRVIIIRPSTKRLPFANINLNTRKPKEYFALSYAWGPTYADGSHLTATEDLEGRIVRVTPHLSAAFERIRQRSRGFKCRVWCDALCINQSNITERNHQVAMMGEIYAKACGMFIWLGDEWDDPWFFEDKESEVARVQTYDLWGQVYGRNVPAGHFIYHRSSEPTEAAGVMIQKSSYFTRRWVRVVDCEALAVLRSELLADLTPLNWQVIQEIALQPSRYVLAGNQFMSFKTLKDAMSKVERQKNLDGHMCLTPEPYRKTILKNVLLHYKADCLDARDRIFALLGISNDTYGIVPGYTEDYRHVYTQFAAACLRQGLLLPILACAVETRSGFPPCQMPSWVPDWQARRSGSRTWIFLLVCKVVTSGQGPFDSGRMHLRVRLYWLCQGVAEDCQYNEAVEDIQGWKLAGGLSPASNAKAHQYRTHACAGCAGYTLCLVEDQEWGLLLMRASSPSVARTEECEEFLLVDWFHVPMQLFMASESVVERRDLRNDHLENPWWFNATALSELTSIVLV